MADKGWIHPYAFENNALSANALGRSAMQDGFTTTEKIASTVIIRAKDVFLNILAAAADYVRNNEDLSAATPITFTLDAQPDVPRSITWLLTHANITAFTLAIVGINARGDAVTETFTEADGWSGETDNAFATITSITLSARTGTGATDTCDIGIGSKLGLSNKLLVASYVYKVSKAALGAAAADYPAASYTAEATYHTIDVSTGAAIVAGDSFAVNYKTSLSQAS